MDGRIKVFHDKQIPIYEHQITTTKDSEKNPTQISQKQT
jgi:hypothetical protein